MKDKFLTIRIAEINLNMIKTKADDCGVSQSELITMAVMLVKKKDILKLTAKC